MILAIDVHYREAYAKAVGVLFEWEDITPTRIIVEYINDVDEYIPGEFYKRELPCLLRIIEQVDMNDIEAILIDGHVYVDNEFSVGLGGHLYNILEKKIPVIGVAKTSFFRNKETVVPVTRGDSKNPLFVSSIGFSLELAAKKVFAMQGQYRIPAILKDLDKLTKDDTL